MYVCVCVCVVCLLYTIPSPFNSPLLLCACLCACCTALSSALKPTPTRRRCQVPKRLHLGSPFSSPLSFLSFSSVSPFPYYYTHSHSLTHTRVSQKKKTTMAHNTKAHKSLLPCSQHQSGKRLDEKTSHNNSRLSLFLNFSGLPIYVECFKQDQLNNKRTPVHTQRFFFFFFCR